MLKTINTQTEEDPNVVGEVFREYTFVGEGTGCYSNFTLRESFEPLEYKDIPQHVHELVGGGIITENEYDRRAYASRVQMYKCNLSDIIVVWFWDGDGTLYFREGDVEVLNDDCKKNYTWEFV